MTTTTLKKRGLGRGLNHLLSTATFDLHTIIDQSTGKNEKTATLTIDQLQSGKYQPRQDISTTALQELAESIRAQGIIQPIIVRNIAPQRYEIIAGERRWRAAQLAGLTEVPVSVRNVPDEAAVAMALIENIQREDLNALEEALALKRLQDEFQLTQQQVAQAIGKSRATVTNLLRLLDLAPEVKHHLQQGAIDQGHAKVLLSLSHNDQIKAAAIIIQKGLSVRETERLIAQWQTPPKKSVTKTIDPNIGSLERKLSDQLGTPVIIQHSKKGRGKLIIHYRNVDILDNVLNRFQKTV